METGGKREEPARSKEAFAAYYALGTDRSLAKVWEYYRAQNGGKPGVKLQTLEQWSSEFGWQDRLKEIAAAQTAEVVELERAILLTSTRELHRRYGENPRMAQAARTDELLAVLGHVRPKEANLNIGGNIVVRIVGAEVEAL